MGDKETGKSEKAGGAPQQEPAGSQAASRASFPIVGIGASAGGLEACTALLKALPANLGMAYVFVPHLDPVRESAFPEILARASAMPVVEVEDGTAVQPDHLYVIPRNCEMTIKKGMLHLAARETPHPVNTTIDTFLRSLAADQGSNAIGIVLSGTASDGTIGLSELKGEGGSPSRRTTRPSTAACRPAPSPPAASISSCRRRRWPRS